MSELLSDYWEKDREMDRRMREAIEKVFRGPRFTIEHSIGHVVADVEGKLPFFHSVLVKTAAGIIGRAVYRGSELEMECYDSEFRGAFIALEESIKGPRNAI